MPCKHNFEGPWLTIAPSIGPGGSSFDRFVLVQERAQEIERNLLFILWYEMECNTLEGLGWWLGDTVAHALSDPE